MADANSERMLQSFKEHVAELAATWYEGDERKAFRHAAFQQVAPDPLLSDAQVIELTAIDKSGDLEIDGWFVDESSELFLLFQSVGGDGRVGEAEVSKFWESPTEVLNSERVAASNNRSVREVSQRLQDYLKEGYSLRLVFASRSGFAPAATLFAKSRARSDRAFTLPNGHRETCQCSLELMDETNLAQTFDDFRAGFRELPTNLELTVDPGLCYEAAINGQKSLHGTIKATELVRAFRMTGMGFRLFSLNPRGPLASAKVNKRIERTLSTPSGRSTFYLLNNGLCATCNDFNLQGTRLMIDNFQIVNGCQTTVTLNSRTQDELEETLVDLKLAVADRSLAEEIAEASNSQTALRARDYASFERQQRLLAEEFARLQPPWFYEIKQGYWRFVLTDSEKARFKTGRRKRHIEVQSLAQASLAFLGYPADALDRVRFVFEGIRTPEERATYDRAFPVTAKAEQLLLPWAMLDHLERNSDGRPRFSTFHVLWLIGRAVRDYYGLAVSDYFSVETSRRIITELERWMPGLTRVASSACTNGFRRAQGIKAEDLDLRDFFRSSTELVRGVLPTDLLIEACQQELQIEVDNQRDPRAALPK